MKDEYAAYFVAQIFDNFFRSVSKQIGQEPWQAVVQNFLYYPDPMCDGKVRISAFIDVLLPFIHQLKELPDPEQPPKLIKLQPFDSNPVQFQPNLGKSQGLVIDPLNLDDLVIKVSDTPIVIG